MCLYQRVVPHLVSQSKFDFSKLLKGTTHQLTTDVTHTVHNLLWKEQVTYWNIFRHCDGEGNETGNSSSSTVSNSPTCSWTSCKQILLVPRSGKNIYSWVLCLYVSLTVTLFRFTCAYFFSMVGLVADVFQIIYYFFCFCFFFCQTGTGWSRSWKRREICLLFVT